MRNGYSGGDSWERGREKDEVTGAYVERGTGNAQWGANVGGAGGNMEGYYGPPPMPPPRPMSFQAPQAPRTVNIPVHDGHEQGQGQEREKMRGEMNEKHEYRSV